MIERLDDILASAASRWIALLFAAVAACLAAWHGADAFFKTAFGTGFAILIIWFAPQLAEYRGFASFRFVDSASPPMFLRLVGWIMLAIMMASAL